MELMKIHRSRILPLLGLLAFLVLACQLFSRIPTPLPPELSTYVADTLTALASPSASTSTSSSTATPLPPTATPSITPTPRPSLTPSDTPIPDAGPGFPPAAAAIPQPAGQTTFILLGSDQRPDRRDFRTDTMVVVVVKPDGSVSLVSFPRDLWVYLPGRFMQRLNTAQEYGGFSLLQATFRYNFGFSPQSYVLTNFSGFTSIVNGLGGIDVPVSRTIHDARDGYFPYGYTVKAGTVHMDGETALWYVRARQVTGDLDRLRRSQEVLISLGQKLLSLDGMAHIPDLYTSFRGAVVTDLTLGDVTGMLPALQKVDPAKLQRYELGLNQLTPAILPESGANVLLPKADALRKLLSEALSGQ
jgi:LCP family protein required for cell wall assembly